MSPISTCARHRRARLPAAAIGLSVGFVASFPGTSRAQGADSAFLDGGTGATGAGIRGTVDATGPDVGPTPAGGGPNGADAQAVPAFDEEPAFKEKPKEQPKATLSDAVRMKKMRNPALPEQMPPRLSPLLAYPRAIRKAGGPQPDVVPNTDVAAVPLTVRRVLPVDLAPFAPIGYEAGPIRVFPYIQQSIGYDSNPEQVSAGIRDSAYSRTEGGMTVQSDWNGQDLRGTLYGAYDTFFSNPAADRPDANGVLDYTFNLRRDTTLDAEVRFNVDTQRPGSPEVSNAVVGRPLTAAYGVTLGGTETFGRLAVGLHGLIDRDTFEDGRNADGSRIDLAYQDYTDYGGKLRVSYELLPTFIPYVEVGGDSRIHDDTIDIFGYRRDSDGIGARIGTTFEFTTLLTGTASAGYAARFYDDPRLKDLTGPTADVSLVWAATPLTTLTINGATSFNETTVPGSSGIESRIIGATLTHALLRNLTLTGAVIYQNNDYEGSPIVENVLTESLKAEYHLSRSVVLTGTLSHQNLDSTVKAYSYSQDVALLGVRFQH